MASRSLRSRTAEVCQDNLEIPAGEGASEMQVSDPSERLGSLGDNIELAEPSQQEVVKPAQTEQVVQPSV